MKQQFRLVSLVVRQNAIRAVQEAPDGYVCEVRPETRRDRQNALMWSIIKDIRDQSPDMAGFSADDVKLRFLHCLGIEAARWLPELDGAGQFPIGQRSSTLTVTQFAALCELMFKWGAENGIKWSRKSQEFNPAHAPQQ